MRRVSLVGASRYKNVMPISRRCSDRNGFADVNGSIAHLSCVSVRAKMKWIEAKSGGQVNDVKLFVRTVRFDSDFRDS